MSDKPADEIGCQGTWRDHLKVHPAADLFPMMSDQELDELGADIKKNGMLQQVVLWSPGYPGDGIKDRPVYLLDGRNRLDACERVGIKTGGESKLDGRWQLSTPQRHDFEKAESLAFLVGSKRRPKKQISESVDPYLYVISANIHRRHLTVEQKRNLIAELLKRDPTTSDREVARTTKTDHKTVATIRRKAEAGGEIPHQDTRTDKRGRKQPSHKPAAPPKPEPSKSDQVGLERTIAAADTDAERSAEERKRAAAIEEVADFSPPPAAPQGQPEEAVNTAAVLEAIEHVMVLIGRLPWAVSLATIKQHLRDLRELLKDAKAETASKAPLPGNDPGPIPECLRRETEAAS